MKKQLIFMGMVALTVTMRAQWMPSPFPGSNFYLNPLVAKAGIGTNNPAFELDIKVPSNVPGGVRVENPNGGPSIVSLGSGGLSPWIMSSDGGELYFDNTGSATGLVTFQANGKVGIAPIGLGASSAARFSVRTDVDAGAIYGSAMNNTSPIGVWGDAQGNGFYNSLSRAIHGTANGSAENRGGNFEAKGGTAKGLMAVGSGGSTNFGGWFEASDNGSGATSIATDVYATSNGYAAGIRANLYGGSPTSFHIGGVFQSWSATNGKNVGVSGTATGGSSFNIGVIGAANGFNPTVLPNGSGGIYPFGANIGIYGTACYTQGWPNQANSWAAWFDNDVYANGTTYNNTLVWTSDRKFKKEITPIENAGTLISKLNPSTYFFNVDNENGMNFDAKKQYGFISQEVETVLPDLVQSVHKPAGVDKDGKEVTKEVDYKGLNYIGFIALLTKGVQEQQALIDELKTTNALQQQQIDELMQKSTATGINQPNGTSEGFAMAQNTPNPFSGQTTINYSLTEQTKVAKLMVYDLSGKQVASFPLSGKGSSSINLSSEKLAAGIYIYSIIADGILMDSKRMVVADK